MRGGGGTERGGRKSYFLRLEKKVAFLFENQYLGDYVMKRDKKNDKTQSISVLSDEFCSETRSDMAFEKLKILKVSTNLILIKN
jgi:hypothetical protein